MKFLANLVRSLKGIKNDDMAFDVVKMGAQLSNHYQIWCHERFHMDGSRCTLTEDHYLWNYSFPRPKTFSEMKDLFKKHPMIEGRYTALGGMMLLCCPLEHHKQEKWKMDFDNRVVTVGRNEILDRTFTAVGSDVNWYVGLIGAGTGTVAETAATGPVTVTGTSTDFQAADVGSAIIIVGAGAAAADYISTVASRTSTTSITVTATTSTTVTGAPYAIEPRPADTMSSKSFNEVVPYSNTNRPTWSRNSAAAAGAMSNSSAKAVFNVNATGRAFGAFLVNNNTKAGTTGVIYGGGLDQTNGSRSLASGDTLNVQIDLSVTAS